MKLSEEFYDPSNGSAEISYEHWHRYLYASQFCKDAVVLDIASGEGYGSFLLTASAKKVIGIDKNRELIDHASEKYKTHNLEFICARADSVPIKGYAIFDVVVSFETIEHLGEVEQQEFLKEIKRLLKPEGIYIVSTPDKSIYCDIQGSINKFHVKEFTIQEFQKFLSGYFTDIQLYGQKIYPVSAIWALSSQSSASIEYRLEHSSQGFIPSQKEKRARYTIALCSDISRGQYAPSVLIDLSEKMITYRNERIGELETVVEQITTQLSLTVSQLHSTTNELDVLRSTLFWRLAKKYYALIEHVFPTGSIRRQWYQKFSHVLHEAIRGFH